MKKIYLKKLDKKQYGKKKLYLEACTKGIFVKFKYKYGDE